MKIIVAVTAASGAIYARQLLCSLCKNSEVEKIALIFSTHAREVAKAEGVEFERHDKIIEWDNNNIFAPMSSGSSCWDSMVIVPCSVGSVGRVASGISQTLIERSADVILKERRKLIMVVRETPLSLIHLRNMVTLTEAGAIILPASPSFYSHPKDIEQLCNTITERIISLLNLFQPHFEWQ